MILFYILCLTYNTQHTHKTMRYWAMSTKIKWIGPTPSMSKDWWCINKTRKLNIISYKKDLLHKHVGKNWKQITKSLQNEIR